MERSDKDWEIFDQCLVYIDEEFSNMRKDVAQTYFVGNIPMDTEYYDEKGNCLSVPEHLIGYWKTKYPTDNRYINFREAMRKEEWVKCKKVEKITYVWESLD